jgi:uncharacterized protein (UPF0210 family)
MPGWPWTNATKSRSNTGGILEIELVQRDRQREIEKHVALLDFYQRNRKGRKKCVHAIQGKTEKLPFFPEHGKGVSQACTVIMLGDTEKKVMEATEASAREESTETWERRKGIMRCG